MAYTYRVIKLLYIARGVPCAVPDGIERRSGEFALAGRKSGPEELVKVVAAFASTETVGDPVFGSMESVGLRRASALSIFSRNPAEFSNRASADVSRFNSFALCHFV